MKSDLFFDSVTGLNLWPPDLFSHFSLYSHSPAPCVPHNIQKDLDCLSGVLNVTWQSTGHFVQFRTSVVSSKGDISTCMTNKHHCVVSNLMCGLTYNVTVWAEDETCNSSFSTTMQVVTGEQISRWSNSTTDHFWYTISFLFLFFFVLLHLLAPCPLSTFLTNINCASGIVSVGWSNPTPGITYTVSAVDATGRRHNCSSTNTGCDLSTLECGTKYNVSITPSRDGCVGRDSAAQMITTG